MDAAFALEVLDKAPYVTVSFTRPDGTPYGVPLSLARTNEKTFYFHCAMESNSGFVGSDQVCSDCWPQGWQFHTPV